MGRVPGRRNEGRLQVPRERGHTVECRHGLNDRNRYWVKYADGQFRSL